MTLAEAPPPDLPPAAESELCPPDLPPDVSPEAYRLARAIDRLCRLPGRYTITLTVPTHQRQPWLIEISRVEPLQRL